MRLRETHNALQLLVLFFFFLFFCQRYREYWGIRSKKPPNHQTANTIHGVRDSVPVLKIHDCYWDTQKFAKFQLLPKHRLNNFQDRDLFLVRKGLCIIYQHFLHIVWMRSGVIIWIKKYIYIHPSDNMARAVCWCIYILLQYHVLITSAHIPNTMVLTNLLVNTYTYILYLLFFWQTNYNF